MAQIFFFQIPSMNIYARFCLVLPKILHKRLPESSLVRQSVKAKMRLFKTIAQLTTNF